MRARLIDLENKSLIAEYTAGEDVRSISYAIFDPTQGLRMNVIRELKKEDSLEKIAIKYVKKIIGCELYLGEVLYREFQAIVQRYEIQTDSSGILVEILVCDVIVPS